MQEYYHNRKRDNDEWCKIRQTHNDAALTKSFLAINRSIPSCS